MGNDGAFFGGVSTGAILTLATVAFALFADQGEIPECYKIPAGDRPAIFQAYDVNRDGIEDVIGSDGRVSIGQGDGKYVPLDEAIENDFGRIRDSYVLEKGEDGRYYTKGVVGLVK